MSTLPKTIQSVTEELRHVQHEIQSSTPAAGTKLSEVDSAALKEFKATIDYVRQLIWTYLQADRRRQGEDFDEEILSLRMQRVTEMLQAIQQEAKTRQITTNSAAVSFLHAVQEIADAAFQRHSTPDSDIGKAS